LITARTPVLIVDTGELADPDRLAELADVVLYYFDAFSDGGLVDVDAGDVPGNALSSEVSQPGLVELGAHGWRAKCDATVAEWLNVLIPLFNTDSDICNVTGRRAVAVWLVEAKEDVRVSLAACHVLGEVSETPLVDRTIRVVCEALVALAPEHGCTDHSMG